VTLLYNKVVDFQGFIDKLYSFYGVFIYFYCWEGFWLESIFVNLGMKFIIFDCFFGKLITFMFLSPVGYVIYNHNDKKK